MSKHFFLESKEVLAAHAGHIATGANAIKIVFELCESGDVDGGSYIFKLKKT